MRLISSLVPGYTQHSEMCVFIFRTYAHAYTKQCLNRCFRLHRLTYLSSMLCSDRFRRQFLCWQHYSTVDFFSGVCFARITAGEFDFAVSTSSHIRQNETHFDYIFFIHFISNCYNKYELHKYNSNLHFWLLLCFISTFKFHFEHCPLVS